MLNEKKIALILEADEKYGSDGCRGAIYALDNQTLAEVLRHSLMNRVAIRNAAIAEALSRLLQKARTSKTD